MPSPTAGWDVLMIWTMAGRCAHFVNCGHQMVLVLALVLAVLASAVLVVTTVTGVAAGMETAMGASCPPSPIRRLCCKESKWLLS